MIEDHNQIVEDEVLLMCSILNGTNNHNHSRQDMIRRENMLKELCLPSTDIDMTSFSIGEGGFGKVYLGKLRHTTEVAVKCVKGSDRCSYKEVENEMLVMKYLGSNPTVLTCYGYTLIEDFEMRIILELAPYGSLSEMVYNKVYFATIPVGLIIAWGCDMANALHFIHSKQVKHRDIKAQNFLVFNGLRIKLCDFGLAKEHHSYSKTCANSGTLPFMAPEIRLGNRSEFSSDIFSFAMTMIQLFTRKAPLLHDFEGQITSVFNTYFGKLHDVISLQKLLLNCVQYKDQFDLNQLRPTASEVHRQLVCILQQNGNDPRTTGSEGYILVKKIEKVAETLRPRVPTVSLFANVSQIDTMPLVPQSSPSNGLKLSKRKKTDEDDHTNKRTPLHIEPQSSIKFQYSAIPSFGVIGAPKKNCVYVQQRSVIDILCDVIPGNSSPNDTIVLHMTNRLKCISQESHTKTQQYQLLQRTDYVKKAMSMELLYPLAKDELIVTSNVCVNNLDGSKRCAVTMIAISAINVYNNLRGPTMGIFTEDDRSDTRPKIAALFSYARQQGAQRVVLGALGCGSKGNPPHIIATLFKDELIKHGAAFDKVYFAILDETICSTFQEILTFPEN